MEQKYTMGGNQCQNNFISSINNRAGGETLNITGSGTIGSVGVGSGKTISLGTLALSR